jgi:cadmium resistance protein CadD (predicted permease)
VIGQYLAPVVSCSASKKKIQKDDVVMGNLLTILVILFISLFVLVTLLEKFGKKTEEQDLSKYARWIYPLMAVMLGAMLIKHFFMS